METTCGGSSMSAMTKKEWMEYLEKTWDAAQKEAWSEPEFECPRCGHCCQSEVSLRDYFAGKAMQVILEHYDIATSFAEGEVNDPEGMPTLIAIDAYVMADAMLKARER